MATKAQMGAENLQQPLNIFRILKLNTSAEGFTDKISGSQLKLVTVSESWPVPAGRRSEGEVDERSRVLTLVLWTPLDERRAQVDQLREQQR